MRNPDDKGKDDSGLNWREFFLGSFVAAIIGFVIGVGGNLGDGYVGATIGVLLVSPIPMCIIRKFRFFRE